MRQEQLLLFGRIARKHRFVLPPELEEGLSIQDKLRLMGGNKRIGELLVDLEYLSDEHVRWILDRQLIEEPLQEAQTLFGELAAINGFLAQPCIDRALKTQAKDSRKGSTPRIGEILVMTGEMTPQERDAILALQGRLRQGVATPPAAETPAPFLLFEAGRASRKGLRLRAVLVLTGVALAAAAAVVAWLVLGST